MSKKQQNYKAIAETPYSHYLGLHATANDQTPIPGGSPPPRGQTHQVMTANQFIAVAPSLRNPRSVLPSNAHVWTGRDGYIRVQFPDNTIALKSPNGKWMNVHQWAQLQPKIATPTKQAPSNYSDWNPATWNYNFNKQDAQSIANGIDDIGDREIAAGGYLLPVGATGGFEPKTPVPGIPFRMPGPKGIRITARPKFVPKTVGGAASAIGGGLVIGGGAAKGVASIIRNMAK